MLQSFASSLCFSMKLLDQLDLMLGLGLGVGGGGPFYIPFLIEKGPPLYTYKTTFAKLFTSAVSASVQDMLKGHFNT